ncbi:MAG: hypothetical protein NTU85_03310 [Candidatus Kaiserbacteria bacterium]|nr:hypothetical protein [Candidatus Kaiserbacteria bacterium]
MHIRMSTNRAFLKRKNRLWGGSCLHTQAYWPFRLRDFWGSFGSYTRIASIAEGSKKRKR